MKSTNYFDTFIEAAADCPVEKAEIPVEKNGKKTVAVLQFEMIFENPYQYTSEEVIFTAYAVKNEIPDKDLINERQNFFSKGQACLRSSLLTKRYGWGVHSNSKGKVALFAIESEEYQKFMNDKTLSHTKAMRSKRK